MGTIAMPQPDDFKEPTLLHGRDPGDETTHVEGTEPDRKTVAWLERWFASSEQTYALARPEDITRFVPYGAEEPPLTRWRIVGDYVERWSAVERSIHTRDVLTLVRCLNPDGRLLGWNVVRRRLPDHCDCPTARLRLTERGLVHEEGCGRVRRRRAQGDIRSHVLSLELAPEDDTTYNGYYPTIPGNDVAHFNPSGRQRTMEQHREGEVLYGQPDEDGVRHPIRGGTEIRGGRAEHRRLTKDMVYVDNGTRKHTDRIAAENEAAKKAERRRFVEREVGKGPRKLGEL